MLLRLMLMCRTRHVTEAAAKPFGNKADPCAYADACAYTCMHTYTCTYIQVHVQIHVHVHIHIHVHIHVYTEATARPSGNNANPCIPRPRLSSSCVIFSRTPGHPARNLHGTPPMNLKCALRPKCAHCMVDSAHARARKHTNAPAHARAPSTVHIQIYICVCTSDYRYVCVYRTIGHTRYALI